MNFDYEEEMYQKLLSIIDKKRRNLEDKIEVLNRSIEELNRSIEELNRLELIVESKEITVDEGLNELKALIKPDNERF